MKFIKRISIWLAAMLAIFLISNTAGALIIKNKVVEKAAFTGFAKRSEIMIHPVKTSEDTAGEFNGLQGLTLRTDVSDNHLKTKTNFFDNFLFDNITVDESHIFFDQRGLSDLSSGIFAVVYQKYGDTSDYMKHAVGVIDVRDFIKSKNSYEIFSKLDNNPAAVIRVNSYTIYDYIIKPVSVTLLDENGTELLNVEFPYDGELIKASDCYVLNECEDKINDTNSFYHKMDTAQRGERNTDRIAHDLINKVRFDNGDYKDDEIKYGIGNITSKHIEVSDSYAQISVQQFNYMKCVIFYTIFLGFLMTFTMIVVIRKFH